MSIEETIIEGYAYGVRYHTDSIVYFLDDEGDSWFNDRGIEDAGNSSSEREIYEWHSDGDLTSCFYSLRVCAAEEIMKLMNGTSWSSKKWSGIKWFEEQFAAAIDFVPTCVNYDEPDETAMEILENICSNDYETAFFLKLWSASEEECEDAFKLIQNDPNLFKIAMVLSIDDVLRFAQDTGSDKEDFMFDHLDNRLNRILDHCALKQAKEEDPKDFGYYYAENVQEYDRKHGRVNDDEDDDDEDNNDEDGQEEEEIDE